MAQSPIALLRESTAASSGWTVNPAADGTFRMFKDGVCLEVAPALRTVTPCSTATSYLALVHIAKTGGTALRSDLHGMMMGGTINSREKCLKQMPTPCATLFREPVAHVISLFMELKYAPWGRLVTNYTRGRSSQSSYIGDDARQYASFWKSADAVGLSHWVDHFAHWPSADAGGLYQAGYNPINFQSRNLACESSPHIIEPSDVVRFGRTGGQETSPSLLLAGLAAVGIAEELTESSCMFALLASNGSLPLKCCNPLRSIKPSNHGVPRYDREALLASLSATTRQQLHNLTARDAILYAAAKERFEAQRPGLQRARTAACP